MSKTQEKKLRVEMDPFRSFRKGCKIKEEMELSGGPQEKEDPRKFQQ